MRKVLLFFIVAIAVASCTKEDNYISEDNNIVRFTAEAISTRIAADGITWDSEESIGIAMFNLSTTDNTNDTEALAANGHNINYISTNSTPSTSVNFEVAEGLSPLAYPSSGSVKFYAYYPYQADITDSQLYYADVSDQSKDIDFMIAAPVTATSESGAINLKFSHRLSKLTIYITQCGDITDLTGVKASINGLSTKGSYNITTSTQSGSLTDDNVNIDLVMSYGAADGDNTISTATATAIVLPQKLEAAATVSFTLNSRIFYINIPEGSEFIEGASHSYSVTLGNDTAIFAGSTIDGWNNDIDNDGNDDQPIIIPPVEAFSSYLEFTRGSSNPENITKIDSKGEIASIISKFRRGLALNPDDNIAEVNFCYLDDNDSNYYPDGTEATLTGKQGDVMVYFPEFWYKYENISDNTFRYYISQSEIEDGVHIEASLLGAFNSCMMNDNGVAKMYSAVGSTYSTFAFSDYVSYAQAKGQGYQIIDYDHHCVIAMISYAKCLTRDIPSVIGRGPSVEDTSTHAIGSTALLGNTSTSGDGNGTTTLDTFASILGIEAPFSGAEEFVDGVSVDNACNWSISTPSGTRTVQAVASSGYIMALALEGYSIAEGYPTKQYFDMVPSQASAVNGSSESYYCDYTEYGASSSKYYLVRGHTGGADYAQAGAALILANSTGESGSSGRTSRLAFRGTINILSTEDYKAQF